MPTLAYVLMTICVYVLGRLRKLQGKACVISCEDPRVYPVVPMWLMFKYRYLHVYQPTGAGADGWLLNADGVTLHALVKIRIQAARQGGAKRIFLVAHTDCKGHVVCEDCHRVDLRIGAQKLANQLNMAVTMLLVRCNHPYFMGHLPEELGTAYPSASVIDMPSTMVAAEAA